MALGDFDNFKYQLLYNISLTESCEQYQGVLLSTTFLELFKAGCGSFAWAFESNMVTDAMLLLLPEADLNQYAIYISNTTLTNPTGYQGCFNKVINSEDALPFVQEIYILNCACTINISNGKIYTIYVLGTGSATINFTSDTSGNVKLFNSASATINISGYGELDIQTNNSSTATINSTNSAVTFGSIRGTSAVNYFAHTNSVGNFKTFIRSILSYTLYDVAIININKFHKSTINVLP